MLMFETLPNYVCYTLDIRINFVAIATTYSFFFVAINTNYTQ